MNMEKTALAVVKFVNGLLSDLYEARQCKLYHVQMLSKLFSI